MSRKHYLVAGAVIGFLLVGVIAFEIVATEPVRGALRTCAKLFTLANRPGLDEASRLEAARSLCSNRYLRTHKIVLAPEGGIVGIPRNLSKNFKAWREGPNVWICTSNRIGPVYQFVLEDGLWRFDGPIGILRAWGEMIPMSDLPDGE